MDNSLGTPLVWYIHGANSTPRSFNYLRSLFPEHDYDLVSYDHCEPLSTVIDRLVAIAKLIEADRPLYLVGHSLGGVVACALAQRCDRVAKVVTIASPLGGSNVAALMRWIAPCQLFEDIHPSSSVISALRRAPSLRNVLSIVTTAGGISLINEENDGVVTVKSQMALTGPTYMRMPTNHFEALLCAEVGDLMHAFLF